MVSQNRHHRAAAAAALILAAAPTVWAGENEPLEDPIKAPILQIGHRVRLVTLATGMTAPNWGTSAPGHTGRLFVVDQDGILWAVDLSSGDKTVFHDVSSRLVSLGINGPGTFDERGFLGVAFHPDYLTNGLLYTYESHPVGPDADFSTMPAGTNPNHQTVVTEWSVPDPADPDSVVDPGSAREILRIDQPQFNHNAGAMSFGPDGMLYIALGDGGAGDDQGVGHVPGGNGQDPTNILGNLIRLDPQGDNSANGQYGIPADNPFVGGPELDEIFAYGFRNPFRFSFDTSTGEIWLGDAGQHHIEEVDVVVAGGNYGWPIKEGSFLFDQNGTDRGFVYAHSPGKPEGLIDPVAEYDHDEGVVVIGGFVYRGDAIPALMGRYVFGEHFQPSSGAGRLFHLDDKGAIVEFRYQGDPFSLRVMGLGQDAAGEVYVMANSTGTPFGDTGVVIRIDPVECAPDWNGDGELSSEDFFAFLNDFFAGDADYDGSGDTTSEDFFAFLNDFFAGC